MQIDPHGFVPCDPAGKFSDDCIVIFDDGRYTIDEVEAAEAELPFAKEEEKDEEMKEEEVLE